MNIALWVAQVLLAAMYGMAGIMKAFQTAKAREQLSWAKTVQTDLSASLECRNCSVHWG